MARGGGVRSGVFAVVHQSQLLGRGSGTADGPCVENRCADTSLALRLLRLLPGAPGDTVGRKKVLELKGMFERVTTATAMGVAALTLCFAFYLIGARVNTTSSIPL